MIGSVRDQAYSPDLFTAVGIDPAAHRLVVVKSAQHFVAGFSDLAAAIVLASGGGPLETDFRSIDYRHVRRPIWPLDDLFGERSEEHTSELQSLMRISYAVFCLKKKKNKSRQ